MPNFANQNIEEIFKPSPSNAQWDVIKNIEGAMVVVAGPGSGKTATMVNRIIYMLANGVKPEEFFISTFTNKATDELKSRIDVACENLYKSHIIKERINTDEMRVGTLHSLFYKLLQDYWPDKYSDFGIIDEQGHIQRILRNKNINFKQLPKLGNKPPDSPVDGEPIWPIYYYGRAKNFVTVYDNIVSCSKLDMYTDARPKNEKLTYDNFNKADVYINAKDIWDACRANRADLVDNNLLSYVDIEDCLYKEISMSRFSFNNLQETPSIKHIIVDEYQDTSELQHKIITKLYQLITAPDKSICVVGDDDQSLYRFRRAEVKNILNFNKDIGCECKTNILQENYRTQKQIIDFYSKWMLTDKDFSTPYAWDKNRQDKTLLAKRQISEENQFSTTVLKCSAKNVDDWVINIANTIEHLKQNGVVDNYNQIAFLAYSIKTPLISSLMDYLESKNIKVYAPCAGRFIKSMPIKLAICALYACFLPFNNNKNLFRISGMIEDSFFNSAFNNYQELSNWIQHCRSHPKSHADTFSGLFYEMLSLEPFRSWLNFTSAHDINIVNSGNLKILLDQILTFEKIKNVYSISSNRKWLASQLLNEFLPQNIYDGIDEYQLEDVASPDEHVLFSTIHSAKGLEFPVVIVGGLDELPFGKSKPFFNFVDKKLGIYEEQDRTNALGDTYSTKDEMDLKRKYYTAFSRAQDLLILAGYEHTCTSWNNENKYHTCSGQYFDAAFKKLENASATDYKGKKASPLKTTSGLKTYSFTTDIAVYEQCPIRYKYMRFLGLSTATPINMLFGTLVHESIESVHTHYIKYGQIPDEETLAQIVATRFAILKNKHGANISFKPERALVVVKNYVSNNVDLVKRIKNAEYNVSNVEDGYILQGNIDLVAGESVAGLESDAVRDEGDTVDAGGTGDADTAADAGGTGDADTADDAGGTGDADTADDVADVGNTSTSVEAAHASNTVELLDFKTGKMPDKDSPLLKKYYRQMLTYAHLINSKTDMQVTGLKLMFPGEIVPTQNGTEPDTKNGVIDLAIDCGAEEIKQRSEDYIKQCNDVVFSIENHVFGQKTENFEDCRYCPLIHFCAAQGYISIKKNQ